MDEILSEVSNEMTQLAVWFEISKDMVESIIREETTRATVPIVYLSDSLYYLLAVINAGGIIIYDFRECIRKAIEEVYIRITQINYGW